MIIFANDDYVVFFDHLHLIEIYHFDHVVCDQIITWLFCQKMSTQNRRRQTFVIQKFSCCCLLLLLFGGKRQCLSK